MARSAENQAKIDIWQADQTTKSEFFRQKLHDYGLLDVAYAIRKQATYLRVVGDLARIA